MEQGALEVLLEAQFRHYVLGNAASYNANYSATSSASIVDWAVNYRMSTLKLTGPLHIIMTHDEVEFPLAELFPQLASEYALSLNPPCL